MHGILADGRWTGNNGIGRFSREVLGRLQVEVLTAGPPPLSLKNLIWQPFALRQRNYQLFFTPGFNPVFFSQAPYVLTICDLIHLNFPGNYAPLKKLFLNYVLRPSVKKAAKIITISEYSKKTIIEWAELPAEQVINVSCGVSEKLTPAGPAHSPGYRYLLHVGNSKPHKNIPRLLASFAKAKIDPAIKLIFTSTLTDDQQAIIKNYRLEQRVVTVLHLTEMQLAEYYRGAVALLLPSLCEGFGLPILEAMACGTPVMTGLATSMPEVAGDAAVFVAPGDIGSMVEGIERVVGDEGLRVELIRRGLVQAKLFSWEETAKKVRGVLEEALGK